MTARTRAQLIICEDTREQRGLARFFSDAVCTVRRALPEGDYSCPDLIGRVAIERKSISDFIGSITHDRPRFLAELERLKHYEFRAIVIEGSMADINVGAYRSKAHPASVIGTICAIVADFNMPVLFCGTPQLTAKVVEKLLRRLDQARTKEVA